MAFQLPRKSLHWKGQRIQGKHSSTNDVTNVLTKLSKTSNWNDRTRARGSLVFGPAKDVVFQKQHYHNISDRDQGKEAESFRNFEGTLYDEHKEQLKKHNNYAKKYLSHLKVRSHIADWPNL